MRETVRVKLLDGFHVLAGAVGCGERVAAQEVGEPANQEAHVGLSVKRRRASVSAEPLRATLQSTSSFA
jgi:hypothetical protein